MIKFKLTPGKAKKFMASLVHLLNDFYKDTPQGGEIPRVYQSFTFEEGFHYPSIPQENERILEDYYLFNIKFIKEPYKTFAFIEPINDCVAIALPVNAIYPNNIKIEKLKNMPNIKEHFISFMYEIFGEDYKQELTKLIKNEIDNLENNYQLNHQKAEHFKQFIENLEKTHITSPF